MPYRSSADENAPRSMYLRPPSFDRRSNFAYAVSTYRLKLSSSSDMYAVSNSLAAAIPFAPTTARRMKA